MISPPLRRRFEEKKRREREKEQTNKKPERGYVCLLYKSHYVMPVGAN